MSLGNNLFLARKKKGLSQEAVSEVLNVSRQTISKWDLIETVPDHVSEKIDWTKAWSKKYPILSLYQKEVNTAPYLAELGRLLENLKENYGYDDLNALLVLKDMLATVWKTRKKK